LARHLWLHAFDRRDSRAPQALDSAYLIVSIWLCTEARRGRFAWGCRSFLVCTPPAPEELGQPILVEDGHRRHGTDSQELGHDPMTGAQASYLKTLCEQAGTPEAYDDNLTKAEASKMIDEMRQQAGVN
jgi:hypothetical protein